MMQEILSKSAIASSIVITDSEDDLPLLEVVQYPCLVVWSFAKYINPFGLNLVEPNIVFTDSNILVNQK